MSTPEPPAGPDPWTVGPTPPPPWTGPPPAAGWPQPAGWEPQPGWPQQPGWQQQPGWPPGQWYGYPSPPKPRRRWLPWVLAAVVLVVGGCGAVVGTFGVKFFHEINGARETANDFLLAVERGDGAAARALLCEDTFAGTLSDQLPLDGQILSHRLVNVSVQRNSDYGSDREWQASANATADLTLASGEHQREVLFLRRAHDTWRVCVMSPPLLR